MHIWVLNNYELPNAAHTNTVKVCARLPGVGTAKKSITQAEVKPKKKRQHMRLELRPETLLKVHR